MHVGDRIGRVDDGTFADSEVTVTRVGGTHDSRQAAMAEARRIAASNSEDAIVVEEQGRYVVAVVAELPTARGLVDMRPHTEAIVAGSGAGVRVRGTSDASTHFELTRTIMRDAGLRDVTRELFRGGLSPDRCFELLDTLASLPPDLAHYSQRVVLQRVLTEACTEGRTLDSNTLLTELERYDDMTMIRPDGYMVQVLTGEQIQRYEVHLRGDGLLWAGPESRAHGIPVGELFAFDGEMFLRVDENLAAYGDAVTQVGVHAGLGVVDAVLDGVGRTLYDIVIGVGHLIEHPIDTIAGLAALPSAIADLIATSPEYFDRFQAMTLEDQVREVTHIATTLATLAGTWEATGATLSAAATSGRTTMMMARLGADGALALQRVEVASIAAAGTRVAQVGTSGIYIAQATRMPDPGAVEASRAAWGRHYGEGNRVPPREPGAPPPVEAQPIPEPPEAMRSARDLEGWLRRHGFTVPRPAAGSHVQFVGPNGGRVTLAMHGGDIPRGTLASIRRQIRDALSRSAE